MTKHKTVDHVRRLLTTPAGRPAGRPKRADIGVTTRWLRELSAARTPRPR